jgi:hypothetical protein
MEELPGKRARLSLTLFQRHAYASVIPTFKIFSGINSGPCSDFGGDSKDSATIIDADAETMTQIDFKKKQYSVITFAEMKQAMETLRQQMDQGALSPFAAWRHCRRHRRSGPEKGRASEGCGSTAASTGHVSTRDVDGTGD